MSKSILVIDDEEIVVEITKRKLEELGFEVITAYDGEQGLLELSKRVPDLIVLDIQMPKMNGYTFLIEIEKIPAYVHIPVIALSAHYEMEPLFKRHGTCAYLRKPLQLQQLIDKVKEVIGLAA